MDQPPRRPADSRATERAREGDLLRGVLLMVAVLITWQLVGAVIGTAPGLAIALGAGAAGAAYLWRERLTFDLVTDLALIGLPAVIIGLSLS